MSKQRIILGVVALAALALAIVALIGVNGTQAHRGRPTAVNASALRMRLTSASGTVSPSRLAIRARRSGT